MRLKNIYNLQSQIFAKTFDLIKGKHEHQIKIIGTKQKLFFFHGMPRNTQNYILIPNY